MPQPRPVISLDHAETRAVVTVLADGSEWLASEVADRARGTVARATVHAVLSELAERGWIACRRGASRCAPNGVPCRFWRLTEAGERTAYAALSRPEADRARA